MQSDAVPLGFAELPCSERRRPGPLTPGSGIRTQWNAVMCFEPGRRRGDVMSVPLL